MKLSPRNYNILFHLHTVSGIVLAAALFIIFFAGAFTLFRWEFFLWENTEARKMEVLSPRFEQVIAGIKQAEPTFDFDDDTYITFPSTLNPLVQVYGHLAAEEGEIHYAGKMDPRNYQLTDKPQSTVGDTLYHLHYFAQIPFAGMWIAGFVSLFFVFALITGVLVHWNNIWSKFWSFSFKGAWKQLWTNAHTVFGLLGLPYQLMYALTGAFYLLLLLAMLPVVLLFHEGKPEKVYALAYPMYGVSYDSTAAAADHSPRLQTLYQSVQDTYGRDYEVVAVQTHHLHKDDAAANFRLVHRDKEKFIRSAYLGYRLKDGQLLYSSLPGEQFTQAFVEGISQVHFATYGGTYLKVVYFILALFSCFVFVSGILVWKEARKNARYTEAQQRFHRRTTRVLLSVCFALFPAVALLFSTELLVPSGEQHAFYVNTVFFSAWLVLSIVLIGPEGKMLRANLLLGGMLGLAVPLVNGFVSGQWFWSSTQPAVWGTDLAWALLGVISLLLGVYGRPASAPPYRQNATSPL